MSAKIMLKLKSINIVYFLTSALLLMVVFGYFFFEERKPVDCATTVYFDIVNNNVPYSFTGSVYLRFHQAADFDVNITEYGTINFNDMKYIIDRNTKMIVSNLSHSKYFELEDTIVNKTKNDNIPDEVYDILIRACGDNACLFADELWNAFLAAMPQSDSTSVPHGQK